MIFPFHEVTNTLFESSPISTTTVVFIHGNSSSTDVWKNLFEAEIIHDYPMVTFDLPGHGESPRMEVYSFSEIVKILAETCKAYKNIVLVGHSLGGHFAIELLPHLQNCKGLLVFGTPPVKKPLNIHEAFLPDERIALLFKGSMDAAEKERFAQGVCDENSTSYRKLFETIADTDPKFREGMGVSVAEGEFSDEVEILRNTQVPVAILHGEDDALVNAEYIETLEIPYLWKQRVLYIENSTHSPHIENPSRFNQLLLQFLEDLPK